MQAVVDQVSERLGDQRVATIRLSVGRLSGVVPAFPNKFMPFMDEPPGGTFSTNAVGLHGSAIRSHVS